jgi:hypothetical protein
MPGFDPGQTATAFAQHDFERQAHSAGLRPGVLSVRIETDVAVSSTGQQIEPPFRPTGGFG